MDVTLQKCFWLPFTPLSDAIQTLSNFHPPSQMTFCIKTTFDLGFYEYFSLLPIKNHGSVGWLRKDDIPGQEFLLCFQAPAFTFRREHFDWLHSPFSHPRDPQGISGRAKSPVTPVNFVWPQDHAYKRAGLPPPPATPFPIGGRGGGRRKSRRRRSPVRYWQPRQGRRCRAGSSAALGNPSPKPTFGIVAPSHERLCMLGLGLIYPLLLGRECILFAGCIFSNHMFLSLRKQQLRQWDGEGWYAYFWPLPLSSGFFQKLNNAALFLPSRRWTAYLEAGRAEELAPWNSLPPPSPLEPGKKDIASQMPAVSTQSSKEGAGRAAAVWHGLRKQAEHLRYLHNFGCINLRNGSTFEGSPHLRYSTLRREGGIWPTIG